MSTIEGWRSSPIVNRHCWRADGVVREEPVGDCVASSPARLLSGRPWMTVMLRLAVAGLLHLLFTLGCTCLEAPALGAVGERV